MDLLLPPPPPQKEKIIKQLSIDVSCLEGVNLKGKITGKQGVSLAFSHNSPFPCYLQVVSGISRWRFYLFLFLVNRSKMQYCHCKKT